MVRGDLTRNELAHEAERAELAGVRAYVARAKSHFPQLRAEALEIAGGIACFTGVDSPLSEAGGLGIFEPVTDETVPDVVRFYTERGAVPRVMVGPMTDPQLTAALARNNFVPVEYQNVLAVDLAQHPGARDSRVRMSGDPRAWAMLSAGGFHAGIGTSEILLTSIELLASVPNVVTLEAYDREIAVASAGIALNSSMPVLFGASVLPPFRGRGWQSVLINDRLAGAAETGARYARACARPLSLSERNFVNAGFVVLYTRMCWEWHFKAEKG